MNVPKHMQMKKHIHQLDNTCAAFTKSTANSWKKLKTQPGDTKKWCTQLGSEHMYFTSFFNNFSIFIFAVFFYLQHSVPALFFPALPIYCHVGCFFICMCFGTFVNLHLHRFWGCSVLLLMEMFWAIVAHLHLSASILFSSKWHMHL